MTALRTFRLLTLACLMVLGSALAHAQGHGGPGGGGGAGGPGGGGRGMGGGGNGMGSGTMSPDGSRGLGGERGSMSRSNERVRNNLQLARPGRWWDDKKTVKALSLRTDQQKRMDEIFNANRGNLQTLYGNLQTEQKKLGSMSKQDLQDEGKVFAAIDSVAQARAELERAYAHTRMQLRKELDSQQLAMLDKATVTR